MKAKYEVGQRVRVRHHNMGTWVGEITYKALAGEVSPTTTRWEYEVTNAPVDYGSRYPDEEWWPGTRWHPLVWEEEIMEVLPWM